MNISDFVKMVTKNRNVDLSYARSSRRSNDSGDNIECGEGHHAIVAVEFGFCLDS